MTLEIFRALGALAEAPTRTLQPVADAVELGPLPTPETHTDLFGFQLFPYASVYLGAEGQLGGDARDRIAGFWRALGLVPPPEPDQLPVLLAAYADLTSASADANDVAAHDDRATRARTALLWEHLLSWLPFFLDRVRARTDRASDFYVRWAGLLDAALRHEARRAARPTVLPLHLRTAPPLDDPRTSEAAQGRAFLAALLAPVRTGMILTRDDLRRAARDLALGSRIGERRFVLEALLGQAPADTLRWLGDEATKRAEDHAQHTSYLGGIATFWQSRATASAALLRALAEAEETTT